MVRYGVNLDELPGVQVYDQTGARTADGRCSFTDSDSGEPNGQGRVIVITEMSFNRCRPDGALTNRR